MGAYDWDLTVERGAGTRDGQSTVPGAASFRPLHSGFLAAASRYPSRLALEAGRESLTYAELREEAAALAATLWKHALGESSPLTAVVADRTPIAFAGVLGALLRGHGYVPLHPEFPADRTRAMLRRSGAREVVAGLAATRVLDEILPGIPEPVLVVVPDCAEPAAFRDRWRPHSVLGKPDLERAASWSLPESDPDGPAYLLFTSGSTGAPKGVAISHRNVTHFIDSVVERYEITERDRLSQTFDMTFDLSVFDMFAAWERGACVCCPTAKSLIAPARYIDESRLTIWFSVPSTALFMIRLGLLKPNSFEALRLSLFCGEALPVHVAEAWSAAAPNSVLENLYGPTEATIACTAYRWDASASGAECEMGVVPIGAPLPGMSVLVVDDDLHEVAAGAEGELLLEGPQVAAGYWHDPEKTAAAFVTPPGTTTRHYRTGDRVRRPVDGGPLRHLGRLDSQIKVNGHRVELGEIEAALRDVSGASDVAAIGWPVTASGFGGVVAFLEGSDTELDVLRAHLSQRLPAYMVPREFHRLDALPRNANGKRDRNALARLLEAGR